MAVPLLDQEPAADEGHHRQADNGADGVAKELEGPGDCHRPANGHVEEDSVQAERLGHEPIGVGEAVEQDVAACPDRGA